MQGDSLSNGVVVIEDEVMVFLREGSEQVEDVLPIILALPLTMREREGCGGCSLIPGDEPVPGSLDCFGCCGLAS